MRARARVITSLNHYLQLYVNKQFETHVRAYLFLKNAGVLLNSKLYYYCNFHIFVPICSVVLCCGVCHSFGFTINNRKFTCRVPLSLRLSAKQNIGCGFDRIRMEIKLPLNVGNALF